MVLVDSGNFLLWLSDKLGAGFGSYKLMKEASMKTKTFFVILKTKVYIAKNFMHIYTTT